jgi:hypothetical protein
MEEAKNGAYTGRKNCAQRCALADGGAEPSNGRHAAEERKRRAMQTTSKSQTIAMGGAVFAAVILLMTGFFNIIDGLAALIKGGNYFLFTNAGIQTFNLTAWGWIFLVFGILQVCTGAALFRGYLWARIIGIALAILNAAGHFSWMGTYPWWSLLIIALDVLVIWSLAVMPSHDKL